MCHGAQESLREGDIYAKTQSAESQAQLRAHPWMSMFPMPWVPFYMHPFTSTPTLGQRRSAQDTQFPGRVVIFSLEMRLRSDPKGQQRKETVYDSKVYDSNRGISQTS